MGRPAYLPPGTGCFMISPQQIALQGASMSESSTRSMVAMLNRLRTQTSAGGASTRLDDGWCRTLAAGLGFRYEYNSDVAQGGWDFYRLGNDLCVAVVDMVAARELPRRYSSGDYLTLSAVLDGNLPLTDQDGSEGELVDGFCTVYGMQAGNQLEAIYRPGEHLRWVTVYLNRATLLQVTGLGLQDLPPRLAEFVINGGSFPCCNVPLSRAASLAALQLAKPPFEGGFRHTFLTAKAFELACHVLFNLSRAVEREDDRQLSAEEHERLQRAMKLIRSSLDRPPNVLDIATAVGLTRQRLQLGFRMIYGDTVGRVRDKVRMEYALDLIRDSKLSMIEIALGTGYEHAASFTRAFKLAFGLSPIQMRCVARDELRVKNLRRGARKVDL